MQSGEQEKHFSKLHFYLSWQGWWFGTSFYFSTSWECNNPTDKLIFFRGVGWNHQPVLIDIDQTLTYIRCYLPTSQKNTASLLQPDDLGLGKFPAARRVVGPARSFRWAADCRALGWPGRSSAGESCAAALPGARMRRGLGAGLSAVFCRAWNTIRW